MTDFNLPDRYIQVPIANNTNESKKISCLFTAATYASKELVTMMVDQPDIIDSDHYVETIREVQMSIVRRNRWLEPYVNSLPVLISNCLNDIRQSRDFIQDFNGDNASYYMRLGRTFVEHETVLVEGIGFLIPLDYNMLIGCEGRYIDSFVRKDSNPNRMFICLDKEESMLNTANSDDLNNRTLFYA